MSTYNTELRKAGAYTTDEQILRDVFTSFRKFLDKPPTLTIEFAGSAGDKDRLESEDLDSVLSNSIIRSKRIATISISGSNYKSEPSCRASLRVDSESSFIGPIRFDATGEQDKCAVLKAEMDALLTARRAWYSLLYANVGSVHGTVLALIWFGLSISLAAIATKLLGEGDVLLRLLGNSAFFLVVVAWLRKKLFPQLVIDIGLTGEIAKRRSEIRKLIFGGIVLALLVGTAGSYLSTFLPK